MQYLQPKLRLVMDNQLMKMLISLWNKYYVEGNLYLLLLVHLLVWFVFELKQMHVLVQWLNDRHHNLYLDYHLLWFEQSEQSNRTCLHCYFLFVFNSIQEHYLLVLQINSIQVLQCFIFVLFSICILIRHYQYCFSYLHPILKCYLLLCLQMTFRFFTLYYQVEDFQPILFMFLLIH